MSLRLDCEASMPGCGRRDRARPRALRVPAIAKGRLMSESHNGAGNLQGIGPTQGMLQKIPEGCLLSEVP